MDELECRRILSNSGICRGCSPNDRA